MMVQMVTRVIPGRAGRDSSIANNSVDNSARRTIILQEIEQLELDRPHHNLVRTGDIEDSQESEYDDSESDSL